LTSAVSANAFAEHVESLAYARRVSEKQFEDRLFLLWRRLFQPLLGCLLHVYVLSSVTFDKSNTLGFAREKSNRQHDLSSRCVRRDRISHRFPLLSLDSRQSRNCWVHLLTGCFANFCGVGTALFDFHRPSGDDRVQLFLLTAPVHVHYRRSAKLG